MLHTVNAPYCTVETPACRVSLRNATKARPCTLLVPADRSLVQIDVHLLGLKIFFDAPRPKFAAKARLLVSPPRRFDISRLHVIHPHDARAQRLHRAHGLENVASPDGSGETVG